MTEHLIHIGYAKTGTNFLRRWFALHPQLSYADGGIAGFNDVYAMVRDGAAERPRPLYRVTSAEGFATPHAGFGLDHVDYGAIRQFSMKEAQAEVCASLAALFPNARVLITTRGFRSMILSGYSQYVRTGGDESLEVLCARAGAGGDQEPWNYDYLIGLYRNAFGEERVILLPYELLRDDPAAFLGAIAKRLGLADIEMPAERPNSSLSAVELAWYPLLARRIAALPLGNWGRGKVMRLYRRAAFTNRLQRPIALLQRLLPRQPVTQSMLPPAVIDSYRNFATTLRDDPLYFPYTKDYLFDEPA